MYDLYSNDVYDETTRQVGLGEVFSKLNQLEKKLHKLKKKKKGCKKDKKKQLKKRIKVLEAEMEELMQFVSYAHRHPLPQHFPWLQLVESCAPKLLEVFIKSRQKTVDIPTYSQYCLPDNSGKK